jgi:oxalate decarboxylase/phosphoglucose isomerase-like protein (cupin superfamily)
MIKAVTHKDIEPVLMDPKAPGGIRESYFIIEGEDQKILAVNPGKNGIEYNKTDGHFSNNLGVEIYNCLFGQGVLVMQRNDENGEAKEFKVITIQPGKQVIVPAGFGHSFVNIGKGYLVILDSSPKPTKKPDTETTKLKRGLAYYIVEKKGEIAFEHNPNYRVHPQISTEVI